MSQKNKSNKYLTVVFAILIMIFSVHIGTTLFKRIQFDATDENIFTLSKGTEAILSQVSDGLKLKLYYSKTAANKGSEGIRIFNNYFQYINDLLEQYVAKSKNKLTLEVIDPRPDTRDEEDAIAYGLKKFNLTETETYFFGLVVESKSGSQKIIEFFDPNNQDKVEYEITKVIYSATNPKRGRVGIISSQEVIKEDISPYMAQIMRFQGRNVEESWHITKVLKEFYDVVKIEKDAEEISGVDVLMVIHPREFSDRTIFNIDQFVMKGGKLIVFLDPMAVSTQELDADNKKDQLSSSSYEFLQRWGIKFDKNKFAGDKHLAGSARFNPNMPPMKALPLLVCRDVCYKPYQDAISSSLGFTSFVFPGALEKVDVKDVEVTPILSTTDKGNTYIPDERQLTNPKLLWNMFVEGDGPIHLGLKAVGNFESNFKDGLEVEAVDGKNKGNKTKKKLEAIASTSAPTAIIVFSDVDFITDGYAFRETAVGKNASNDNGTLVLNAVETLSGATELLSVRSKPRIDRSFQVIRDIELEAEKKTANKVKEINDNIAQVQKELNALGRQVNEGNIALIQNEGLRKKKELSKKIALLKRELRDVKREGREKVEDLGKWLQALNTLLVPALFLVIGVVFYTKKRKLV